MKILRIETWRELVPLSRPYTIALATTSEVELFFLRIISDTGLCGLGSAAPFAVVTGESAEACAAALDQNQLSELDGWDPRAFGKLTRWAEQNLCATPAARAAFDMACWDLLAKILDQPLVDLWGRCHQSLPTSITIGIKSTEEALAEAEEYLGRGFTCLKVKLGLTVEEDLERLRRLREAIGPGPRIRVDANQGYDLASTRKLAAQLGNLDIEFLEQPLPAGATFELRALPAALLARIALDESLQNEADAVALSAEPVPIWVIKLMKCGGPSAALTMARVAESAGKRLMWGCMDESRISIAAALHVAYASPATRYLDLDGSFDLARDPAQGGFEVVEGCLRIVGEPGFGVRL